MAYSIVAACVLLLKYEIDDPETEEYVQDNRRSGFGKIWNSERLTVPTVYTSGLATICVTLYACWCIWMALVLANMGERLGDADALAIVLLSLPIVLIIITMTILVRQPKSSKILSFSVPFMPWFPALSIMINIYLMAELDVATWIRFGVWIAVGLLIYIFYGWRFSKEKERRSLLGDSAQQSIEKLN